MSRALALGLVAALILPFAPRAQSRPDFTGTWTMDASRSQLPQMGRGGRGGGGRGAGGGSLTQVIKQTAADLTIEIQGGPLSRTAVYKLDGSPTTNEGGRGATITSKTRWDGAKLIIESTREIQGFSLSTTETRSLEAGGKEMVVETTAATPQGEQTFKQVFTKN
jgi:hypothetical protein